jgi:hypothetical protein
MSNNIDIEKLKSYINDLEETITPLQKSKSKGKTEIDEPDEKPKITRTLTDRKKEQLQKAREVRQSNVEIRKKTKKLEHAKLLLESEISKPPAPIPNPTKSKSQSESEHSVEESSSDESSEPEIVIVKKSKKKKPEKVVKKKKPPKKIVIEESSTESESEESDTESDSPQPIKKKKDFGKSHKNKRSSVIKVHDHPGPHRAPYLTGPRNSSQPVNYFCD